MGTRILEGRGFRPADEHAEHVCVLSASAAAYFFPQGNALGRFVYSGGNDPSKDQKNLGPKNACRVIGIAENARFRCLREAPPRMLYTVTGDWSAPFAFMAVRSSSTSVAAGAVRTAVRRVTPGVPDPKIFTFNELVRQQLRSERMLMSLSACFAGIALLLTAIGLYGLLARIITLRTKEIGLRLALGAQPHHALASVMRQTLRLMLVGIGIGLLAALGVTHLLRTLLFGVQVDNPWMLSAAVAVLILITLLASYIPARRAARVDPMVALREE